jgi:hypothetical protein
MTAFIVPCFSRYAVAPVCAWAVACATLRQCAALLSAVMWYERTAVLLRSVQVVAGCKSVEVQISSRHAVAAWNAVCHNSGGQGPAG